MNDTTDRNELEWITSLKEKKIIQIECIYFHSYALTGNIISNIEIFMNSKDDGFVYSWGHNNFGQLGHGDTKDRKIPTLIDGLTKIKKIYCGYSHTMAINGNKMGFPKILNPNRK